MSGDSAVGPILEDLTIVRETIVPLPAPPDLIVPAKAIRSTTIISSFAALRALRVTDAYFAVLPAEHRPTIVGAVAGQWLPMDVGIAHYAAVESLGLSSEQARDNGRRVAERVQNSYFATLIRPLGAGITPWSVLPRAPSLLARLVDGGACAVYRQGPKEAHIEIHGVPLARFAYVRLGWAGMFEGTLELIAKKVYARDVSTPSPLPVAALSVAWA
jgi:hypothetical protein